jgi:hypothetical protein
MIFLSHTDLSNWNPIIIENTLVIKRFVLYIADRC